MKITIEKDLACKETEIIIRCREIDAELRELISSMGTAGKTVAGEKDGETYFIPLTEVYYFETVEGRLFFYTKNEVYKCETKLYLIEESLKNSHFSKVSKSAIVNLQRLKSIKKVENSRLVGTMTNGEKIVISRFYVPDIREKLGV